jgi:hypothetical protein
MKVPGTKELGNDYIAIILDKSPRPYQSLLFRPLPLEDNSSAYSKSRPEDPAKGPRRPDQALSSYKGLFREFSYISWPHNSYGLGWGIWGG